MNDSSSRSARSKWLVVGILVFVVAGAAFAFWLFHDDPQRKLDVAKRTQQQADARELTRLKNLGLARLENSEALSGGAAGASRAEDAFAEIAKKRPDLALGVRNLAVANLVLLAGGADPDRLPTPGQPPIEPIIPADLESATQAIAALERVEPDAPTTAVIKARVAALAGDFELARATLDAAMEAHLEAAWVAYERYRLDRFAPSEDARSAAQGALGQAYAAAPNNLWLTREWLGVLAERESPEIIPVLKAAKELLEPLAVGIEQRTRVNVIELADQAIAAAESQDWPQVMRLARTIINITVQEEQAQSDKLAVDRNALEFVAFDFPDEFYEAAGIRRRPEPEPIPVTFTAAPDDSIAAEVSKLRDVAIADVNLDGSEDFAFLDEQGLKFISGIKSDEPAILAESIDEQIAAAGFDGIIAADLDADVDPEIEAAAAKKGEHCQSADPDIVIYGEDGLRVLRNDRGDGDNRALVPVEQPAELQDIENVKAAAFADFDLDGDLDLVISADKGLTLWANVGNLAFEDRTPRIKPPPGDWRPTTILPVDLDRDVDLDLILAGQGGPAGYLENLRHGNLRWRPFDPAIHANDIELIDADGNASWDLIAATPGGLKLAISQTPQPGRWVIKDTRDMDPGVYRSLRQVDYDNDGLRDLLAIDGADRLVLLRNDASGFEPAEILPNDLGEAVALDVIDRDQDGDEDLIVVTADNQAKFLNNEGGNANHWLDVSLVAQQVKGAESSASGRVNHAGLGSLLELKSGPIYQAAVVRDGTTRFGLGKTEVADVLRVLWTNGIPQNTIEPDPKTTICEKQSLKGSCPYLYTFDGETFVFSTDLLWNSPIGLQFAEGVIAPTRPWEYLRIPTPVRPDADGYYPLRITEELWEAGYFDLIELTAVDHPPGAEVYTNEKVGPAEIAAPRLHTALNPRQPIAARDGHGRDILDRIAARDDRYVKAFNEKYTQGLCEAHAIELHFGDISSAERVTLFLVGWVYPSDTSTNVQRGQRDDLPRTKVPALSVPNAQGEWVEVLPVMGFPGGKTKTIAIDLTGKFLCEDRRVRIDTNMEIYWDAAFITTDEPALAMLRQACPLAAAELHHRGVSAAIPHPGDGPERYDYTRVRQSPAWPPMRGDFTRYGDVAELLREADDRQVVMFAGDEIRLRFAIPKNPPPPGWTRTFILHNVGYDKDADLNTVYGQSAEPLPFRAMRNYPYIPEQHFPDSLIHREYLEEYQTRKLPNRAFWTQLSGP